MYVTVQLITQKGTKNNSIWKIKKIMGHYHRNEKGKCEADFFSHFLLRDKKLNKVREETPTGWDAVIVNVTEHTEPKLTGQPKLQSSQVNTVVKPKDGYALTSIYRTVYSGRQTDSL